MKFILITLISLILLQCASYLPTNEAAIDEKELYDHIAYLASDELEGRKPGTPEGKMAATYIADHFKKIGLAPLAEDGFQYFEVITSVSLGEENSFTANGVTAIPGEDYTPTTFSVNTSLSADLAFVGYGFQIDNDSLTWNDYSGVDVNGKWVMILNGTPEVEGKKIDFDIHGNLRHKLLIARDAGAVGAIFVSGEKYDEKDELIEFRIDRSFSKATLPVLSATRKLADQLLADTKNTISALEAGLDESFSPNSFSTDMNISATIKVNQNEVTTQNVVALLPGSDPDLKDEFIVIGGHYDHLGWGGKGSGSRKPDTTAVHNGADDNASGVSAVLEIAEKLALGDVQPKRSILFMTFGAEEMGLLGSKFFTSNPLIEMKNIKTMVNLDMMGRLNPETRTLTVGGAGTAKGLQDFLNDNAQGRDFILSTTPDGYGPSDHAAFYIEDIPVLFFFTGITEDYHTPSDDIETINFYGIKVISEYAHDLVLNLATMDEAFDFQEAGPKGPPKGGKRGKVKMGIIPDFAAANADGFLLGGVVPGGPAARSGMQKGDVMITLEGRSVKNVYDYMGRMAEVKPGMRISVEVLREGEKHILIVQL